VAQFGARALLQPAMPKSYPPALDSQWKNVAVFLRG
jgi:hypothetical protein